MHAWQWGAMILVVLALPVVVYGMHRFALRLERLGYIDYTRVTPRSVAGCLAPFQTAIEPPAKHVLEVQDQRRGIESDSDGTTPNP
jgi:hypothetical protein